jgi:hypothetical protein
VKSRTILTAVAATAAAAGLALTPLAASAHVAAPAVKKHVYSFLSLTKGQVGFTKTTGGEQDTDVNAKGKVIGYDELYLSFNPKANTGIFYITVVASGGFLYASAAAGSGPVNKGTITGGTGAFKGAKGTIVAKNLNAAGTKTAVTITFFV